MIQFHSKNFMFKKTVNRMLNANYVPKIWDTVSILDSKDNLISYHSSYSKEFEGAVEDNGIFLVWHVWNIMIFNMQKLLN